MLRECIESILALSLRAEEREIILVDDGSCVSLFEEILPIEKHILYIRQKNQGLSVARNTGLRVATGQYVQFIDSDDKLIRTGYEHCIDIIRYGNADMVMFEFSEKENPKQVFLPDKAMNGVEYLQHINTHSSSCGYLFKRTLPGALHFTPGIYHEDEEFTPLLMLHASTVIVVQKYAYMYRKRKESITHNTSKRKTLKRLDDKKNILFRFRNMYDRLPYAESRAIKRRTAQLTMDYLYNIIIQTQNRKYLIRQTKDLKKKGLYPLPNKNYTAKYKWFRRVANNKVGLSILNFVLPRLPKEK